MTGIILKLLGTIGSSLGAVLTRSVLAFASEKVLTIAVVLGLEKLAKHTTNEIDDNLVKEWKAEMNNRKLDAK